MALFKRRRDRGGVAVAERRPDLSDDFSGSTEELRAEIGRLTAANRASRDRETERRLLWLRHYAGVRLLEAGGGEPAYPEPAGLPDGDGLPEIGREQVTPGLVRAGVLRDGCLLVRGLVDREQALRLADQIDHSFAARAAAEAGEPVEPGYYEEFDPPTAFAVSSVRPWIKDGGGVLASDAPRVTFDMLDVFETAGVSALVADYLGEPPLLSLHKTTLRKADPAVGGAWHQDGAFMGEVRALNLWLSLSRCGDEAPGLDLVPRRLDRVVIEHGDMLDVELTRAKAAEAAGEAGIVRPIFEPGDALFFDELFLHQTASDPAMPKPRFAIESWFFGASAFPGDYAPLAV
jgi:phytanoyl-CoA dioxygenase PhyH